MTASAQAPTFSLVYVSQATAQFAPVDEDRQKKALTGINKPASANNRRLNVRGILLLAAGHFVQWLEGDEGVVRKLMATIAKDPRHTDVQIIYTGYRRTMLTEWSMSLVARADLDNSMLAQIKTLRAGARPRSAGSVPAGMILSIVCPSAELGTPESRRRRIALLGQSGIWSAALLEHVSKQFKAPVAHTRLLGNAGFERGAILDYLDVDHPRLGPLRLLSPSGDMESMSWMTGIKEKLTACVLFYSQNSPDAITGFTTGVQDHFGATNQSIPFLCLFGRTASPLVEPVLDWFAIKDRQAFVERITLADSDAVWRAVEELLEQQAESGLNPVEAWGASGFPQPSQPAVLIDIPVEPMLSFEEKAGKPVVSGTRAAAAAANALDGRKVQQREAAIPLPVIEPLVVPPSLSPAPVVEPHASAAVAVVNGLTPQPAAPPVRVPALALSEAGKRLLEALSIIDNVRFVGAQCLETASQVLLKGQAFDAAPESGLTEEGFVGLLRGEALIHKALMARMASDDAGEGPQVLTRSSSHFNLSFTSGLPSAAVVLLQTADGAANEALVRFNVLALLNKPIAGIFVSA